MIDISESKSPDKEDHKEKGSDIKIRKSTLKTAGLVIIVLIVGFFIGTASTGMFAANSGGTAVPKDAIGQKALKYLNENLVEAGSEATLVSVKNSKGLYEINTLYKGQEITIFATPDGSSLFLSEPIDMNVKPDKATPAAAAEVPKTDKPSVELFVMSYCPYGTQAEKGILPAARTLGDKIDFRIEYTHFTLHGQKEDTENYRQLCIREEQSGKFLPYIACILNSTDVNNPGDVTACMNRLGIDADKVNSCMADNAQKYYETDSAISTGYGVQGSPTLVINGVQSSAGRDPESYLAGICAAFNNPPAECSTQLSSTTPGPGFGYDSVGSAQAAGCGV